MLWPMSPGVLPPHPQLTRYWLGNSQKRSFLRQIFDDTATDYDRLENILSLGSGKFYRRRALARAGLRAGMSVLDVAIGTGLVAREAKRLVGADGRVTGVDPSIGMVEEARMTLDLPVVLGVGEQLPFEEQAFDFLSMGYALRHLADLRTAFSEYFRVLKPGGRICILELVCPEARVQRKMLEAYFRGLVPILARMVGTRQGTQKLWTYYWETIEQCVPTTVVLDALATAGFIHVRKHRELGLFAEYTAVRPTPR
ncbi:MAG: class I SAM-dependent methyltransferase [Burkholderiales bacterium]|nr:class I SAM-dependent methyltransferase [Phycisphaerae bacterium]